MEAKITRADVLKMLLESRREAHENGQHSPAIRAAELLGKEIGMFVDRSESVNTNYNISDQPLNEDDWAAQFADEPGSVH